MNFKEYELAEITMAAEDAYDMEYNCFEEFAEDRAECQTQRTRAYRRRQRALHIRWKENFIKKIIITGDMHIVVCWIRARFIAAVVCVKENAGIMVWFIPKEKNLLRKILNS